MLAALRPLIATASLGLLLSAIAHVLSVMGVSLGRAALLVHAGIFVVWIPATLIAWKIRYPDGDLLDWEWEWTSLLRGSPIWLNGLCALLLVYLFLARGSGQASAIWMFFYCVPLSVLYSAHRQPWLLVGFVCPNGHKVSHLNRFCPTCGACLPKRAASA